jgi:hypothetical protein
MLVTILLTTDHITDHWLHYWLPTTLLTTDHITDHRLQYWPLTTTDYPSDYVADSVADQVTNWPMSDYRLVMRPLTGYWSQHWLFVVMIKVTNSNGITDYYDNVDD